MKWLTHAGLITSVKTYTTLCGLLQVLKLYHLSQERSSRGVSEQDTDLIRVRYAYMPKKTGINGNPSRDFCRLMVAAGNKVWTKEAIELASNQATNPGWGAGGSDFYNIWFFKGGGSCQHFWERRTYLRKDNKRISVNQAS